MNDSLQPWEKALSQLLEKIIEEGKEVPSAEIQALIDLYPENEIEIRDTLKSVDLLDKILEVPTQADSALPSIKGFELKERIGLGGMGAVYRGLDLQRIRSAMRGDVFVDLRNVYEPVDMRALGFNYHCVGRL